MINVDVSAPPRMADLQFHLAFRDRLLEDEYLARVHRENRSWLIGGTVLGTVMMFVISPSDAVNLSADQHRILQVLRLAVWLPTLIVGLAGFLFIRRPRRLIMLIGGLGAYSAVCVGILAAPGGSLPIEMVAMLDLLYLIFVYFFTGLPFRWAAGVAVVTHVAQIATVLILHPGDNAQLLNSVTMAITSTTMGFLTYRLERASRQTFFAQVQLQAEYQHRLTTERDRVRWLETVTGFLRHELKNAMTGIGSSLALAEQTASGTQGAKYLERAKRSLEFMRRFLRQAAEATSLESALAEQELEVLNLSQLVEGRVRDYAEEIVGRSFTGTIDQDLWVRGNAERLVQMLDKLANNAVEHSAAEHAIEVVLRAERGLAFLLVRDIGDALPDDLDRMFEPFVSQKLQHGKGNLGLGLYVARVIATRHGGKIYARRLRSPDGAELAVELPRHAESTPQI